MLISSSTADLRLCYCIMQKPLSGIINELFSKSIISELIVLQKEYEPRYEKTGFLHMRKTKTQISCAVTAQLISAFVFAILIAQSLYYLNPKFQASSHLLLPYSPVFVGPGRKPRRPVFSERGSYGPITFSQKCFLMIWCQWIGCIICTLPYMSLVVRKPVFVVSGLAHTHQAVQPQKMARCLKFRI